MATTTYFGWETPDDTDLVKDGAAAIRTLGSAIDTSMSQLEGGTTGQILSKTSATDMAFTWINNDQGDITAVTAGTGISGGGTSGAVTVTNSMATAIDAKGDLIVGTGADAFSRLAVGATNGQVLTVDSAEATGLKYASVAATKSFALLNSGGTALTGATTVTVSSIGGYDQYYVLISGASAGSSANIYLRLNTDTGNNYNLFGYVFNMDATYASGMMEPVNLTSQSKYRLASQGGNTAGTVSGGFTIAGANTSGLKMITASGGGIAFGYNGHSAASTVGYYNSATVITSISAFSDIGNFDAGTMFIYGAV